MQISVLEYFERGALLRCRDKVAVQDHSGQYSFGQLERFAKNCGALISSQTANQRGPIPVFLPKSCQSIAADLGILYSGNAYANLDVKSPSERLRNILDHLHPNVIVTCAQHAPALRAIGVAEEKLLLIEPAMVDEVLFDDAALLRRWDTLVDTDPFCLIHTSGSTGQPKGVVLNHRSTIDFVDWALERFDLQGGEVMGSLAPIYFDAYTLEFCMMLARGATMIVVPENLAMFPLKLVEFIAAHPINFIFWVPTIMVNIANLDLLAQRDLGQLATVFFIGEVFPTKQLNYWRRHLPQAKFVNLYGPVEITVACTYYVVDRELAEDEKLPVGFPCRNTEILVLNERNQLAAVDEQGEICVRGSSLALGYFNNPERTAKAFAQNPLNPHYPELIYRTGDVGYWNSRGELMFLGRRDFQIKHLGFRIELGEIEHAALQVAGISNCCVVYNRNAQEITLFYESDHELTPAFIRERLCVSLPKYMLPVVSHWLKQMPRNPNGKIDRAQLVAGI